MLQGNVLGTKKTLKEQMRENKRMINRSIRELDRERAGLERQQEKLIKDIKKAAKDGQMVTVANRPRNTHSIVTTC
jgi:charged multivesicular body protein 2A